MTPKSLKSFKECCEFAAIYQLLLRSLDGEAFSKLMTLECFKRFKICCKSVGSRPASYGPCQCILSDEINMRRIADQFLLQLSTQDQRDERV